MLLPLLQNNLLAGGGGSVAYSLSGATGSYTLTGNAATFKVGRLLSGAAGSYVLTGNAATFKVAHVLSGAAGSYAITGNTGTFSYVPGSGSVSYSLSGATGAYTLTGNAAAFKVGRLLSGAAGAYNYTGNAGTLTYSAGGTHAYTLSGAAGSYAITGNDGRFGYVSGFQIIHGPGNKPWKREKGSYWDVLLSPPLQAKLEELEPEVAEVIEAKAAERIEKPITDRAAQLQMRRAMDNLGFQYEKAYKEIYLQVVAEMQQAQEDEAIAQIIAALI